MKNYFKLASLLLLAVLVFVPMQSAAAAGLLDGRVIFGQSFTLKSGETMNGDLVVFGGSATIEDGATINGNTLLGGGLLTVNGEITGDVAVVGGSVKLGPTSHIHGNLSTVGSSLDRADGSQIDGQIYNTATSWVGSGNNGNHPVPPVVNPTIKILRTIDINFNPFWSMMNALGQSVGVALLAMLLMLFLAPQAKRVAGEVTAQPLTAGGLGLLTVVVAPVAIILFTVTLILIPAAVILVFALVVAGVFGWIAIGLEVGQRFTKAIHQEWHPSLAAGLGTFALTLVAKALTGIPVLNCVGWLVPFLLGLAAIGAVIMTRFGTYMATTTIVAPPANPSGGPSAK